MNRLFKYTFLIRNIMVVMFFIDYGSFHGMLIPFGAVSLFLIINDYLRYYRFYGDVNRFTLSTAVSMVTAALLLPFDRGYISYYFIGILNEVIMGVPKKWSRILLYIHGAVFFIMVASGVPRGSGNRSIFTPEFLLERIPDILFSSFMYASFVLMFFSFKVLWREKDESNRLNRELKEYSEKVEELAVSKERNRVAQEIHDSLGHSLTALIMHLDFLEKIMDKDTEKARELVIKTQSMARDSMKVLRRAVYALKEEGTIRGLADSINELINNVTSPGVIAVDFKTMGNIEELSPDIKNMVYRTIQEGLTNGIKHGEATAFKIDIGIEDNCLRLLLKDNGRSCPEPVRGNGLRGIEERAAALGGTVSYSNNYGFGFDIRIPAGEAVL